LLIAEPARESHDGAFGCGVVEQVGPACVRVYGRAGDDGVAAGQVRQGVFGEEEEGVDIRGEGVEPLLSISVA
jgi:hypothetical protein